MFICSTKKALRLSAFFIVSFLLTGTVWATTCGVKEFDEKVKVLRVVDGDTLVLTDKRKIRLIGVNSPELVHYLKRVEPFSVTAKQFLESILPKNKNLFIKYGAQQRDRYGRLLAHLFLKDGRNVNAMLLEKGLASAVVVPPNINLKDCYFAAESKAKMRSLNIWGHRYSQHLAAEKVSIAKKGFHFIKGRVIRVGQSKGSIWLQLAKKFTLRIKRKDFKYFPLLNLNKIMIKDFSGKIIYVRGWVYEWKRELYLQVRHADMMKISE